MPLDSKMRVKVKLFATLAQTRTEVPPGTPIQMELNQGGTVQDLIAELGLPPQEVRIVFVNGLIRDLSHPLQDGDEVSFFPSVGGG